MKKGAGRKPDPYRQRLLKKSGITREEGRHMSIELLEQLVRCKSPEARRVILKARMEAHSNHSQIESASEKIGRRAH